jgi:hypothetical protein
MVAFHCNTSAVMHGYAYFSVPVRKAETLCHSTRAMPTRMLSDSEMT